MRSFEGLGERGDIVALRCMPLECEKGMVGAIMPYKGAWIFSVMERGKSGHHAYAASQAWRYVLKKEGAGIGMEQYSRMYEDGIRFDVGGKGPQTVFRLDGKESEARIEKAREVLRQLGVPDSRITLDPNMATKVPIRP